MSANSPLHRLLEEFASDISTSQLDPTGLKRWHERPIQVPDPVASRIKEAYERGVSEGRLIERRIADVELAQAAAASEAQIESVKSDYASEAIERLAREIEGGIVRAQSSIGRHLSAILGSVLSHALTEAAIDQFVAEVTEFAASPEVGVVEISGPADFIERIKNRIDSGTGAVAPEWRSRIKLVASHSVEATMIVDDAIIETRLGQWLARVEEAIR